MTTGKQLFTTLADGKLTVEIVEREFPQPTGNQVLVQMEAAPINPSDLAILTSSADLENAEYTPGKFVADMPEPFYSAQKARHGQRLPAGNEGAGVAPRASRPRPSSASAWPACPAAPIPNTPSPMPACACPWGTSPPRMAPPPS